MKGKLLAIFGLVALLGAALSLPAMADDSVPISATVTAQSISVTVAPTSIDYGALAFETSRSSTALSSPITFTATNNGNVTENFSVKGADATGTDPAFTWTITGNPLNCATQTNLYRHSVTPVGGVIFLTTDQQDLASGVAPSGTKFFTSEFFMPCNGSAGTGQTASTTITVVATGA